MKEAAKTVAWHLEQARLLSVYLDSPSKRGAPQEINVKDCHGNTILSFDGRGFAERVAPIIRSEMEKEREYHMQQAREFSKSL